MEVVVVGMHRSGTSLIASILHGMGLPVGDEADVLPANPWNPEGFWEARELVEINDALLAAGGASWASVADFDLERIPPAVLASLRDRASQWLARRNGLGDWTLKDPRLCMTLPFWLPLFRNPVVVFVSRDPMAVACSLRERDRIPLTAGLLLWQRHVTAALRALEGRPLVHVAYEELISAQHEALARLHADLRAAGVQGIVDAAAKGTAKVNAGLDHRDAAERDILTPSQRALKDLVASHPATAPSPAPAMAEEELRLLREFIQLWSSATEARVKAAEGAVHGCVASLLEGRLDRVKEGLSSLRKSTGGRALESLTTLAGTLRGVPPDAQPIPYLRDAVDRTPREVRVIAILAARNEARVIGSCLEHYARQGVGVYVIDHESEDGTRAIVEQYLGRGVVGLETRPYEGGTNWARILSWKEDVAQRLDADWFLHIDADEFFLPPRPFPTLPSALAEIGAAGYNACNALEIVFVPTVEHPRHEPASYVRTMRWYYPFAPRHPHRACIWRRTAQRVDLQTSGGHNVAFPGRRLFPVDLLMKHYICLDRDHALAKYAKRTYADPAHTGWHGWRRTYSDSMFQLLPESMLRRTSNDDDIDASRPATEHLFIKTGVTP